MNMDKERGKRHRTSMEGMGSTVDGLQERMLIAGVSRDAIETRIAIERSKQQRMFQAKYDAMRRAGIPEEQVQFQIRLDAGS